MAALLEKSIRVGNDKKTVSFKLKDLERGRFSLSISAIMRLASTFWALIGPRTLEKSDCLFGSERVMVDTSLTYCS